MKTPVLEMKNVYKHFSMTAVLSDVSIALYGGETHALVGENGAGKSTLIKIMTGIYRATEGDIYLEGELVAIHNSQQAQAHGIAAIYQEPMIFPDLDVAENIFISHHDLGPVVNWRTMYDNATAILGTLGSM